MKAKTENNIEQDSDESGISVSAYFSYGTYTELAAAAAADRRSVSRVINMAVEEFLPKFTQHLMRDGKLPASGSTQPTPPRAPSRRRH